MAAFASIPCRACARPVRRPSLWARSPSAPRTSPAAWNGCARCPPRRERMTEKLALGIDLGGTQLRVALVDAAGGIVRRAAAATDLAGPQAVLGQIRRLCSELGVGEADLIGIGVSAPGPLDSEAGTIIAIPTLPGWDNFPLAATLA